MFDGAKCWTYRPTLPQGSESPHSVRRLRPLCGISIKSFGTRFFSAPLCGDSDPCGDPDPCGDLHPYGNSGVNLSRKPGLHLCCDLLQHSQGVPRVCSFRVFTSYTYIDFARLITRIVFHMKCNHIQLSYYVDGSFCSILSYSV